MNVPRTSCIIICKTCIIIYKSFSILTCRTHFQWHRTRKDHNLERWLFSNDSPRKNHKAGQSHEADMDTDQFDDRMIRLICRYPEHHICIVCSPSREHCQSNRAHKLDNLVQRCDIDIAGNVLYEDHSFLVCISRCYCYSRRRNSFHRLLPDCQNSSRHNCHILGLSNLHDTRRRHRGSLDLRNNCRRRSGQSPWFLKTND